MNYMTIDAETSWYRNGERVARSIDIAVVDVDCPVRFERPDPTITATDDVESRELCRATHSFTRWSNGWFAWFAYEVEEAVS